MNSSDDELPDDDLAEVYGTEPSHVLTDDLSKTDFQPWHHPRKQYVRISQWCSATQALIPELGLAAGDPFRYLTLPGNELLDVRAIHGVCQRAGVKLRYLGFNSVGANKSAQAELALSQSEVRALSHVDGFSRVLEHRLEAVANPRSPVADAAKRSGPFHAINLDLCDSIAFRPFGSTRGSPLAALAKLLELQLQSTKPWLLFITTRAEPGLVGDFAREGFDKALTANMAVSPEFRQALASTVDGTIEELEACVAAAWAGQDAKFLRLFCMGLGKWLLSLLCAAAPPRELTLISSCFYQSGMAGPDMLSLAFKCSTPSAPLHDRFNILDIPESNEGVVEVDTALKMSARIAQTVDLDQLLSSDWALSEKLIKQSSSLLGSARYDPTDYETWARVKLGLAAAA